VADIDANAGADTGVSAGISAADIRRSAMDLLARREHSYRELIQKLSLRFADSALIYQAVDRLRDERLQSDYRFAETYLYSRAQRLFGPQRIKAELRERGIADDIVATVFAESEVDWAANQVKLLRNKFGEKPPVDFSEKAKRLRFLQYRGFSGGAEW
jgi:regulatory protein